MLFTYLKCLTNIQQLLNSCYYDFLIIFSNKILLIQTFLIKMFQFLHNELLHSLKHAILCKPYNDSYLTTNLKIKHSPSTKKIYHNSEI